jgi:hypothetical protein
MFAQIDPSGLSPEQLQYGSTFLAAMLILALCAFFGVTATLAMKCFGALDRNTIAVTRLADRVDQCPIHTDSRPTAGDPRPGRAPPPAAAIPATG